MSAEPFISQLRTGKGSSKQFLLALFIFQLIFPSWVFASDSLPVPSANFDQLGVGIADPVISADGLNLTVNQEVDRAYLNWDSFNIGVDNSVTFNQLNNTSIALNKIHSGDPSQILGNLTANGQIYLLNGSGIIFGENSQVNVASLVATTLDIDEEVFRDSSINALFVDPNLTGGDTSRAALFAGDDSDPNASIHNFGTIVAESGGNILIAAPNVINEGEIRTTEGQTILAGAKERLYLLPSTASELRGFVVELGGDGGVVSNEAAGKILSERGNITLLASAVHQRGEIRSTTDSTIAGSIYLLSRDHGDNFFINSRSLPEFRPESASADSDGDIENIVKLYQDSVTEIALELERSEGAADAVEQFSSRIDIEGKQVVLDGNAEITAKNGELNVAAVERGISRRVTQDNELTFQLFDVADRPEDLESTRLYIDEDVRIDLSGSDAQLSVEDNLIEVDLFSNELRDSPLQRDGALRGETVVVDRRVGTPLADVSAVVDNAPRSLAERTSEGGQARFWSDGDLVFQEGASIDISGGTISYEAGEISTTKLISERGIVDISEADPNETYLGVFGGEDGGASFTVQEQAYQEGSDAGSVQFAAHAMVLQGDVRAETTSGLFQQAPDQQPEGGTVTIGLSSDDFNTTPTELNRDFRAPTIVFDEGTGLPFRGLPEQALDALDQQATRLNSLWAQSGVENFVIRSNGEILIGRSGDAGSSISLPAGVSIDAEAFRVQLNQSIESASGDLKLVADGGNLAQENLRSIYFDDVTSSPEVVVADDVTVDLSGEWSNDYLDFVRSGIVGFDPIVAEGGSIELDASKLGIGDNVRFDVSASVHVDESGTLDYFDAGSISLTSRNSNENFEIGQNFDISGYSYGTGQGGTFDLSAPSIIFSDSLFQNDGQVITSYLHTDSIEGSPVVNDNLVTVISSQFLKQGGFQSYDFQANSTREFGFLDSEANAYRIAQFEENFANQFGLTLAEFDLAVTRDTPRSDLENPAANTDPITLQMFDVRQAYLDGQDDLAVRSSVSGDLLFTNNFEGGDLARQSLVFPAQSGSPQVDEVATDQIEDGFINVLEITNEDQARALSQPGMLSDRNRGQYDLSVQLGENNPGFEARRNIVIDESVDLRVDADTGSSFSLLNTTAGTIDIAGDIQLNGGQVNIELSRNPANVFENNSFLVLRDSASIDVSSLFERDFSDRQFFTGESLDAGSISLTSSGYLLAESGAQLIADGSSTSVNAAGVSRPGQLVSTSSIDARVNQIGDAGEINLNSDEGTLYLGSLSLDAANSSSNGGTLNILTDAGTRTNSDGTIRPPSRVDSLFLSNQVGSELIDENKSILSLLEDANGTHLLSVEQIENSGATDFSVSSGELVLANGVDLSVDGRVFLRVDKIRSEVGADGIGSNIRSQERIAAGYLSIGDETATSRDTPTEAHQNIENQHQLRLEGGLVDVNGQLSIEAYSQVFVESESDIRFKQNETQFIQNPTLGSGRLQLSGDLVMSADRIYGVSNTYFDIIAGQVGSDLNPIQQGSISLFDNGAGLSAPILSANTNLSFNANDINVDTEVAAPFGQLAFNARRFDFDANGDPIEVVDGLGNFTLGQNGVLVTSAQGERIPFGFTINAREWFYDLRSASSLADSQTIITDDEANLPETNISIVANRADFADQSVVDISRSGDLFAVEFIPGTGGSVDYLTTNPNRYAVIPDYDLGAAAFDQRISEGSTISIGQQIVIADGAALPAGTYTLLPAEYAHLDGAYIVEVFPDSGPILPTQPQRLVDGTPLVAGYFEDAFTGNITNDFVAVSVREGSQANLFSEYEISDLSEFAPQAFDRTGVSIAGTVFDAGSLSLFVDQRLDFDANLVGDALNDQGAQAAIDISATEIVVGPQGTQGINPTDLVLSDEQLSAFGTGSVLLGGVRTKDVDEDGRQIVRVATTANSITVASDSELSGQEVLLTANTGINVEAGAQILSEAEVVEQSVNVQLDSADASILGVSNRSIASLRREGNLDQPSSINLDQSAVVSGYSLIADAAGSLNLSDNLISAGGDVLFGAAELGLGSLTADGLSQINLSALDSLSVDSSLTLRSGQNLVVSAFDPLNANANQIDFARLTINSSGLDLALDGNDVVINVDALTVNGTSSLLPAALDSFEYVTDATGNLSILAQNTVFGGTVFNVNGGGSFELDSANSISLNDQVVLQFADQSQTLPDQTQVTLLTDSLIAGSGSDTFLISDGTIQIATSERSVNEDNVPASVGGKIQVRAEELSIDTRIQANSGVIELVSNGDVSLGTQSNLDVSGQLFDFFGNLVATDAGRTTISSGNNIRFEDGATIDVSAPVVDDLSLATRAGLIELFSESGELSLAGAVLMASADSSGGRINVDTSTFAQNESLSSVLALVDDSGFDRSIDIRIRNENDAVIAQNTLVSADQIRISSDSSLTLEGSLNSGATSDGEISLYANDSLTLASTSDIAVSGDEGKIILDSSRGSLDITNGAQISTGEDGVVRMVALQSGADIQLTGDLGQAITLDEGSSLEILSTRQIALSSGDGSPVAIGNADISNAIASEQVWIANSEAIKNRLNAEDAVVGVRTEFASENAINFVATNGDFAPVSDIESSRIGELVIRSEQDVVLSRSLSDGFRSGQLIPTDNQAYSFSVIAGADSASANALDVKREDSESYSLTLMDDVHVRTSVGDIQLASSGDFVLSDLSSVVYTAGRDSGFALDVVATDRPAPGPVTLPNGNVVENPNDRLDDYVSNRATPIDGGSVFITAGGNIGYDETNVSRDTKIQLFADWLITQRELGSLAVAAGRGQANIVAPELDAGLYINYDNFNQGFGAFGGGDLHIDAGGDLVRIAASVPTTIHNGGDTSESPIGNVNHFGEGDLEVNVRGDIISSDFLVGNGQGLIQTEGGLFTDRVAVSGAGSEFNGSSIFALMDGTLEVNALNDLNVAAILDPGFIDVGAVESGNASEAARASGFGKFITIGDNASASFRSIAGDFTLSSQAGQLFDNLLLDSPGTSRAPFIGGSQRIPLPINTSIQAISKDINLGLESLGSDVSLGFLNAANGSFDFIAGGDINFNTSVDFVRRPDEVGVTSGTQFFDQRISEVLPINSYDSSFLSSDDNDPSLILSGGDITFLGEVDLPEQVRVEAEDNISIENRFDVFHKGLRSETSFNAGNNFGINIDTASTILGLRVIGPGSLNVSAGNDVTLGTSNGIQTGAGSLDAFFIGSQGADVSVLAGTNFDDIDSTVLIRDYIENGESLRELFTEFERLVQSEIDAQGLELSLSSLESVTESYFQLPGGSQDLVSNALESSLPASMNFNDFVRSTYAAIAVTNFVQRAPYSELLLNALQNSESGLASLTRVIDEFSPLPTSIDLLDGNTLTERTELISIAFRALDESERLDVGFGVLSSLTQSELDLLGRSTLFTVLSSSGELANLAGNEGYDLGFNALADIFPGITYDGELQSTSDYSGDIDVFFSRVYTLDGGDINFLTPGGSVNGGVVQSPTGEGKEANELGVVVQQQGDINAFLQDSYLVNQSRAFTLDSGNILMWASDGNIDAGRGSRTATSIPPPQIVLDQNGNLNVLPSSVIAGSGIRQFDSTGGSCDVICQAALAVGVEDVVTSVNLIAPNGEVNAGDAGIGASGNINIAAQRVVGADNIDVGGVAVGIPVDSGGLSAGLSGLSSVASAATNAAADSATDTAQNKGFGDDALAWLEVFIVGYGDDDEVL